MKRVASLPSSNTCYFKRKYTDIIHRQEHMKRVASLPTVKHLLLQEKAGNFFIVGQPANC